MSACRRVAVATTVLALATFATSGSANVSLKNGNFFIGYTDAAFSGGLELKIERVYNSKASFHGMFGFGWGSDYEVYCTQYLDGAIVISENGGGAQNEFLPEARDTARADAAAAALMDAALRVKDFDFKGDPAEYRRRIRADSRFRHDEEGALRKKKDAQVPAPPPYPVGTKLVSQKFGFQILETTAAGYQRVLQDGNQTFDQACQLLRVEDRNHNFIQLSYQAGERAVGGSPAIASLRDGAGHQIDFTWQKGHVVRMVASNGRKGTYTYNGDELVRWKTDDGSEDYTYEYDPGGRHNLVAIGYKDGTRLTVTYNPTWRGETVHSVRDRDGSLTIYGYTGLAGERRFSTGVESFDPFGALLSTSRYEYENGETAGGQRFTRRLVTLIDGDLTETEYNAAGLPVRILRGKEETRFAYDAQGHVTKKETPIESSDLSYDPCGKVASVSRYPPFQREKAKAAVYRYDARCNLVFARSSDGDEVSIDYDAKGRIHELRSADGVLQFEYNESSRPVRISRPGVGTIRIEYKDSGDIEKVDSDGGPAISRAVTSAFQKLLDIIRPAGISLSF